MANRKRKIFSIENSNNIIDKEISVIFGNNNDKNKIFVSFRNLVDHTLKIIVHKHSPTLKLSNKRIDWLIACVKDIEIYNKFIEIIYDIKNIGNIDAHDILEEELELKLNSLKFDLSSYLKVFYSHELNKVIPQIIIIWQKNKRQNLKAIEIDSKEDLKFEETNLGFQTNGLTSNESIDKLNLDYLNGEPIYKTEKINILGKIITVENGTSRGTLGIRGNFAEKEIGEQIHALGFYVNNLIKENIGLAGIIKDTVYVWGGELLKQFSTTNISKIEVHGIKILDHFYDDKDEYTKPYDEDYIKKRIIYFLITAVLRSAINKVLKEKSGEKYEFLLSHIKCEELIGMRDLRAYQLKQIKPIGNTFWGLLRDDNQIEIDRLNEELGKFEKEWLMQLHKNKKYGVLDLRAIL